MFDLVREAADGSGEPEPLVTSDADKFANSVSPDGLMLAYTESPSDGHDLWLVPPSGPPTPRPFRRTPFNESQAAFSPDGRWIAYQSDESGQYEVFVQSVSGDPGRQQISINGGSGPVWSRTSRHLYYRNGDTIMRVAISAGPSVEAGAPEQMFEADLDGRSPQHPGYDVTPQGDFIIVERNPSAPPAQIDLVLNWFEELKRRVPIP